MAISNISTTNQPSSLNSVTATTAPSAATSRARADSTAQEATIVTLSAKARLLSRSQNTTAQEAPQAAQLQPGQTLTSQAQFAERSNTATTQQVEAGARDAAEAVAAQPRETENRHRRINTYA